MIHVIFDLEATCTENDREFQMETIEIGAVILDGNGTIIGFHEEFIKPIVNPYLTYFCTELTTIKQSDVDSAHNFPTALHNFIDKIQTLGKQVGTNNYRLWSWGYYDKNQLRKDCDLHNISTQWLENNHYNLRIAFQERNNLKKKPAMPFALKLKSIPLTGTHHRGIDDAQNIAKLFIQDMDWYVQNVKATT